MKKQVVVSIALAVGAYAACSPSQQDGEAWVSQISTGCIIGGVFGIILTAITAVPLCCGQLKPQGKIIGGASIGLGVFFIFIPLIASAAATSSMVSKICDGCSTKCTDAEREEISNGLNAGGVIVAYFFAMGWFSLVMGIVASSMGCCILCKCCKMADEPQQGTVVGDVVATTE
eukprot:TRINITY_DN77646_c0_g1_i1.p1 TRINITY_DN77646_c0_g1~~TRINITY_DN77646_c0_g1_i1.p1  ORF type:complete len:204 (-),score=30.93 TRINITY_DN77646_c0_g1_i1:69-590(-)